MTTDSSFHDFVTAVSDDEAQTDLDNISEEEMAAAANESDSASDTDIEAAAEVEVKPPPKKIAKTSSGSKSKSIEPKTPKKRKAVEVEKKSSGKKSDKTATTAVKKTESPSKPAKSSSKPPAAPPVPSQPKKGVKLPACTGTIMIKLELTTGTALTVTGTGSDAISGAFRAALESIPGAKPSSGRRIVVNSANCVALHQLNNEKATTLFNVRYVGMQATLDMVFTSIWESFRSHFQAEPLFEAPASA